MMLAPEAKPDVSNLVCEPRNTVIVTGFGPFGTITVNASWEAVRLLPATGIEQELKICLVTEQIPVSYEEVEKKIPQMWDTHKPLLVIHVGVDVNSRKITLEQVAQQSGYIKEDIHGRTPASNKCSAGSTPSICSDLELIQLSNEINSTDEAVQTQLSVNAGRYLCEYIYYTSLSIDNSRTVFIHVPPLEMPYTAEQLAQGLATIIRSLVQQLRRMELNQAVL